MVKDDQDNGVVALDSTGVAATSLRRAVRRAQQGDVAAFHHIYEQYSTVVYAAPCASSAIRTRPKTSPSRSSPS